MKHAQRTTGGVEVRVKGRNLTLTPALHDLVVSKMQRLDKFLDTLAHIDVELWTEAAREADQKCHVEATTRIPGRTLRATTVHGEMHAAVDEAIDKLTRQLNRHKERTRAHHGNRLADMLPGELDAEPTRDSRTALDIEESEEILLEQIDVEPMFDDEAIDELKAAGTTFLVFLNAHSEQLNVAYRRADGRYAVIRPRS